MSKSKLQDLKIRKTKLKTTPEEPSGFLKSQNWNWRFSFF